MMPDVVVKTQDLTKRYGEFVALDALSISLNRGNILGFIGPNGAGKTTTIKVLVGLVRPTSGTASIAGVDCVKDAKRIKQMVGYMPDVFGSYDNMRVREYLDFFGAAFKIPRKQRKKRIEECLEITGSTYMQDRYTEALSHGMKQRVALTRILLHDPEVLILDEPANGLDPQARIEVRQTLLDLAAMGKTLIVTSHILPELSRICDTVAIVTQGKLRAFGTLDQIMHALRQRRTMEVVLRGPEDVTLAAGLLRRHLGPDAEVTESLTESEVRFQVRCDDETLSDFTALFSGEGVRFSQFREVPMDLEDAFLSVTRSMTGGSGDRPAEAAEPAMDAEKIETPADAETSREIEASVAGGQRA